MNRFFEISVPDITLPKFDVPWPDGAAIATSLKSRIPSQKSSSKLPMLLGVAVVIVVLVIVAIGVKKMCGRSSRKMPIVEAELDGTPVVVNSEES
jgi:hypothetical protein